MKLSKTEPLAVRAAVTAAVTAVVHVAVLLGLPLTPETETGIGSAVDAVGLLVLILWARAGVTANAKVVARVSTSTGQLVAGDAAAFETGEILDLEPAGVDGRPTVAVSVPVDRKVAAEVLSA